MEYKFTINDFEGPLDLLLHLIKESNINICDINIVEITEQYLNFIEKEQNLNLNIASEYLIMAAELIEIKSKMLLPKQEKNIDEETDIKENLINKLIEYNKYKGIIPQLKELNNERNTIYTKSPENLNYLEKEKVNNESSDLHILLNAFNKFLNEQKDNEPLKTTVTKKEYSIEKRNKEIKNIINFIELFDTISKEYIVITFLSILDLAKKNEIIIEQDKNFKNIILKNNEVKSWI